MLRKHFREVLNLNDRSRPHSDRPLRGRLATVGIGGRDRHGSGYTSVCSAISSASSTAIDGEVEQSKLPDSMIELQSNPDSPDLLQLQRGLLAEQFAFVPRYCTPCGRRSGIHE
jgi:hypothetical protein